MGVSLIASCKRAASTRVLAGAFRPGIYSLGILSLEQPVCAGRCLCVRPWKMLSLVRPERCFCTTAIPGHGRVPVVQNRADNTCLILKQPSSCGDDGVARRTRGADYKNDAVCDAAQNASVWNLKHRRAI